MGDIQSINDKGEKHGYWEIYLFDLFYRGWYVNNKIHGYWEKYYYNGKLDYKGNLINGKRYGYFEFYSSKGFFIKKEYYHMGVEIYKTSKNKFVF